MDRKRHLSDQVEGEPSEEGWTLAGRKKGRRAPPSPEPSNHLPTPPSGVSNKPKGLPRFKLLATTESPYQTIRKLEMENPTLRILAKPNLQGQFILLPKDRNSTMILRQNNAFLQELNPQEKKTKAIVGKYPLALELEPLISFPMWRRPSGA